MTIAEMRKELTEYQQMLDDGKIEIHGPYGSTDINREVNRIKKAVAEFDELVNDVIISKDRPRRNKPQAIMPGSTSTPAEVKSMMDNGNASFADYVRAYKRVSRLNDMYATSFDIIGDEFGVEQWDRSNIRGTSEYQEAFIKGIEKLKGTLKVASTYKLEGGTENDLKNMVNRLRRGSKKRPKLGFDYSHTYIVDPMGNDVIFMAIWGHDDRLEQWLIHEWNGVISKGDRNYYDYLIALAGPSKDEEIIRTQAWYRLHGKELKKISAPPKDEYNAGLAKLEPWFTNPELFFKPTHVLTSYWSFAF